MYFIFLIFVCIFHQSGAAGLERLNLLKHHLSAPINSSSFDPDNLLPDHPDFVFSILKAKDVEECAILTASCLAEKDPTMKAIGLTKKEVFIYTNLIARLSIPCKVSVIARDKKTRELLSCALNLPDSTQEYLEKYLINYNINEKWKKFFSTSRLTHDSRDLSVSAVATRPSYLRQNVMSQILFLVERLAQTKGYLTLRAETTSDASLKTSLKCGWEVERTIPYKNISIENFKNLGGSASFIFKKIKLIQL